MSEEKAPSFDVEKFKSRFGFVPRRESDPDIKLLSTRSRELCLVNRKIEDSRLCLEDSKRHFREAVAAFDKSPSVQNLDCLASAEIHASAESRDHEGLKELAKQAGYEIPTS